MNCDMGSLRAYLDDALAPPERTAVGEHLRSCTGCQAELALLAARAEAVMGRLSALAPRSLPPADPARALARFRGQTLPAQPTWREAIQRRFTMSKESLSHGRWRPLAVGAAALLCLAILFSFAPVRQAAADFLGIFRVRKFAVIPLDQQQRDRLESLFEQAETAAFGEPQLTREMGPEQAVADAAQATALAGYGVRTPGRLPEGALLEKFAVQAGPAMHFEIDRATLEAVLSASGASIAGLPQAETLTFDVDVASSVLQQYRLGANQLELLQVPSPTVNLPEGIDPVALAETGFLFLGMSPDDARRIATSIDWTSTLVIPLPSQAARAREVSVDGGTGLLIEEVDTGYKHNALLWERDGILYFLKGTSVDEKLLLDVADSLR